MSVLGSVMAKMGIKKNISHQVDRIGTYYAPLYDIQDTEQVYGGYREFAELAYAANPTIFSVENRRIRLLSEATFKWRSLSDKTLFGTRDLAKLEQPWPGGSTGDLIARMEQDAALSGNAFVRDGGDRLERLRPDWVTIVSQVSVDHTGRQVRDVVGYVFDPVGDPHRSGEFLPVGEVAHWAPLPDPCANFRGMSWLTPLIREINSDTRMSEFRDAFFKNAATANLIVKYQQKVGPDRIRYLRDMIDSRHTGSQNAFGTLIFDEGADATVVGADMGGAAFDSLQAASETRIASAGDVPAVIAGLRQGMQASSPGEYQAAMRGFVDLWARPSWRGICAALERLVVVPPGAQLWYDTSDVSALQQGEQDRAATVAQLATTMNTWIMAGFTPESVVAAATSGDTSLLQHSGLVSVQMQQISAGDPGQMGA